MGGVNVKCHPLLPHFRIETVANPSEHPTCWLHTIVDDEKISPEESEARGTTSAELGGERAPVGVAEATRSPGDGRDRGPVVPPDDPGAGVRPVHVI